MAQRVKNKPELKIVVSNIPEVLAAEPAPEQVEMPFAIVNGEPVTQMPKDLYIPPQAMEVFLEAFEGPLDLLLYLIRRQNLNILDIPLAEITRQYMKYIEVMTELQLELAGEYMVMAATLAEIKSRMLLPRPKVDAEGNEEDPRAELVRRLQEYERFKRAAESIDALPRLERDVWATSAELKDRKVVRLLPTVTLQEMLIAFKDVVVRSEMFAHHHIQRERLSVRERMGDILTTLEQSSFVEFVRLFRLEEGRMGVTVTFMALLELVREGLIEIVQAEAFAPIHVRAAGASRKLHVVGGNEALAAEGAVAVGAVGDGVAESAPAAGVLTTPVDAGLAGFAENALDPNFVDDSDDELDDGPLVGVDDVVGLVAPAAPVVEGAGGDADSASADSVVADSGDVGAADVGSTLADSRIADTADVGSAFTGAADAGLTAVVQFVPAGLGEPQSGDSVLVVDLTPLNEVVQDELVSVDEAASASILMASEPVATDAFAGAELLASGDTGGGVEITPVELDASDPGVSVLIVDPAPLSEVVQVEESTDVVSSVIQSAAMGELTQFPASDVVADVVDAGLESAAVVLTAVEPSVIEPTAGSDLTAMTESTATAASTVASESTATSELVAGSERIAGIELIADIEPIAGVEPVVGIEPAGTDVVSLADVAASPIESPVTGELSSTGDLTATGDLTLTGELTPAGEPSPTGDLPAIGELLATAELPVATNPPVDAEPPTAAHLPAAAEPAAASELTAAAEPIVSLDPAVFAPPAATIASAPSSDTPLEEPPPFDVEYPDPAEEIASGEQAVSDDDVSLVGETPVAGDVSLIGDESVSGGPAVEVEEFAFDELPALDETRPANQQPAAGAPTVVNENAGTDELPSPGEESDD